MTAEAAVALALLELEDDELVALHMLDDLGGHRHALELGGVHRDGALVAHEQRGQRDGVAGLGVEQLDLGDRAQLDLDLLAAGLDDCVHGWVRLGRG